tara:strand:- start:139 stop:408 length:270 start_codon:yes stop_codon:yes gene_type:complete
LHYTTLEDDKIAITKGLKNFTKYQQSELLNCKTREHIKLIEILNRLRGYAERLLEKRRLRLAPYKEIMKLNKKKRYQPIQLSKKKIKVF